MNYFTVGVENLVDEIAVYGRTRGPLQHAATVRNQKLTRANLFDNAKILYYESNFKKLTILEALTIKNLNLSINSQCTGSDRTLQLFH